MYDYRLEHAFVVCCTGAGPRLLIVFGLSLLNCACNVAKVESECFLLIIVVV